MMILPLDSDLLPIIDKQAWLTINKDKEWQKDERLHCFNEPWYWLVNYVYTERRDEKLDITFIERFPPDEYLRYVFYKCFVERKLAIDKSRQVRMTWLIMAYLLWNAQFHKNELIVCQTKKEKDADEELVRRAHFMHGHQPGWLKPRKKQKSFCRFELPDMESKIIGIPSGPDQIRSKNPNRVLLDEGGFFEGEFEDCLAAALACCGDIKVVSTANAGEWEDFILDRRVV